MKYLLIVIVSYLLGSIPSGLLIGKKLCNIDIRDFGSKNIGTTNMFRILGVKPAVLVLLADMAKGIVAVIFANYLVGTSEALLLAGIVVMLGHNYSLFLSFKGGRGVATGLGVICILMPKVTLIVFTVWALIVYISRYVSLGSIVAAGLVPILAWYFAYPDVFIAFGLVAAIFIIVGHRDNIKRLLSGTENKIKAGNMNDFKK